MIAKEDSLCKYEDKNKEKDDSKLQDKITAMNMVRTKGCNQGKNRFEQEQEEIKAVAQEQVLEQNTEKRKSTGK